MTLGEGNEQYAPLRNTKEGIVKGDMCEHCMEREVQ